ncbi:MAG: HTH domain-containing protein [Firmicutes bacterium]|nr:HTH domain-containing protein [Bacillota bacterium]MDI6707385.1 transcription repressor NadR [Bacillota bacterium]
MESAQRRKSIQNMLRFSTEPITGTELAERFGVSRQVIVQDIAIIRAAGEDIIATPRGYIVHTPFNPHVITKTFVCRHYTSQEIEDELTTIVDYGGKIIDVIIEHPIYGEIRGILMISSRQDVRDFMESLRKEGAQPLSSLTGGIHLHTVEVKDETTFRRIERALKEKGYILEE